MKMIIDWDTVISMSEEIDVGDSLGTKKKMVDLDDLYSIGEKVIECWECKHFRCKEGAVIGVCNRTRHLSGMYGYCKYGERSFESI